MTKLFASLSVGLAACAALDTGNAGPVLAIVAIAFGAWAFVLSESN